ncbi:hypothetical protein [Streptomyces sp. NPDC093060]|uniref:hypothetical protein n=1 Tax=Streptomyces sp. NPDC093060 TaxID=3366019 RepID=UPI0038296512
MPKPSKEAVQEYVDENRALAEFRRAEAALYENAAKEAAAGITHETLEYLRLNQAVIDAGKRLPKRFKRLAKGV